jgi:NAD(P)H-nitrite reductase large subunit
VKTKLNSIRKEYFEIPWASMRAMVDPSIAKRSVINHRDYFTNGRLVISSAVNVTETEVMTADGQLIPYDFLVIATGHSESVPESKTERLDQYKAGKIYVGNL